MSFDRSLEKAFRGMFGRAKVEDRIHEWRRTGRVEKLEHSDDEDAFVPQPPQDSQMADDTMPDASASEDKGKGKAKETIVRESEAMPKDAADNRKPGYPPVEDRKRFVYRGWPRDPNGPVIGQLEGGKQAGNGVTVWGATTHDIYRVNRLPKVPNLELRTSGSRLAAYMKKIGETEHAASEIAWAEEEAEPMQRYPCDISQLIRDWDHVNYSWKRDSDAMDSSPDNEAAEDDPISPFDQSNYPSRPVIPFSQHEFSFPPPDLQSRIPLPLLPQKLSVHDPWDILTAKSSNIRNWKDKAEKWEQIPDIVRSYRLHMDNDVLKKVDSERMRVKSEWEADSQKPSNIWYTFDPDKDGTCDAPIVVPLPPLPCPQLVTPEAHLYLSPAEPLGEGNHSFVFDAEWELPRTVFFKPQLCQICMDEIVEKALLARTEHEKEAGSQRPRGKVATTRELIRPAVEVEFVGPGELDPDVYGESKYKEGLFEEKSGTKTYKKPYKPPVNKKRTHKYSEAKYMTTRHYDGPVIELTREEVADIQYQYPQTRRGKTCQHMRGLDQPLTCKVRLAAKLSIHGDNHLELEAANYARFPDHFFEHWTGLNIIPPLIEPVPVGAMVPQFYGYYRPEKEGEKDRGYLSPILLLEKCGSPIDVKDLSVDEKYECASLFLRMHCAGWAHNSVYPRNIVMQEGSPFEWPLVRSTRDRFFRLIDFGRSSEMYNDCKVSADQKYFDRLDGYGGGKRMLEEQDILKMFRLHHFSD